MSGIETAVLITIFFTSLAVSFGLTVLSRLLAPTPDDEARSGWRARIYQSKSPIAPRDFIYGEVRKSGTVVYEEVTNNGKYFHIVIALGTGEIEAIPVIFLDDNPIYDDDLDSDGEVNRGDFKKHVRIHKYLGTDTQSADVDLIDESDGHWTSLHKLQGICYIYLRLKFNRDVFSAQPAISAYIKGKKVNDIRNALLPSTYSPNPALVFRDYVTTEIRDMGVGFDEIDIDDFLLAATANDCDEFVTTKSISYTVSSTDGEAIFLEPRAKASALQTGDKVVYGGTVRYVVFFRPFLSDIHEKHGIKLATSYENAIAGRASILPASGIIGSGIPGTPSRPSAFSVVNRGFRLDTTPGSGGAVTTYRWRVSEDSTVDDSDVISTSTGPSINISGLRPGRRYYFDVRAENSVGNSDYSSKGNTRTPEEGGNRGARGMTSTARAAAPGVVVTKIAEPRYTCSGVIDSSRTPKDNMTDILSAMGGKAVYTEGKWKVRAAVYNPALVEYDESDIVSKINLQTKHSLRERFNAVKGQYISSLNLGVPAEYPQIKNSFYQNEDGGERIFGILDLPFTPRPHAAQRLAKIKLEEHRQSIIFKGSFNLTALAIQPTDTILLSISRMGWDRKPFEVVEWEFVEKSDDRKMPVFMVDVTLRETASGIYDWNMGEETTTDLAPNTNLSNPLSAVTGITVEFEVIIGEDGTAYTRMRICWDPHPSPSVAGYSIEYRKVGEFIWTSAGFVTTETTCIVVEPVEPGVAYNVRIRARTFAGLDGPWGYFISTGVRGDRIPPGVVTDVNLVELVGGYYVMWKNPADLDLDIVELWEEKITP